MLPIINGLLATNSYFFSQFAMPSVHKVLSNVVDPGDRFKKVANRLRLSQPIEWISPPTYLEPLGIYKYTYVPGSPLIFNKIYIIGSLNNFEKYSELHKEIYIVRELLIFKSHINLFHTAFVGVLVAATTLALKTLFPNLRPLPLILLAYAVSIIVNAVFVSCYLHNLFPTVFDNLSDENKEEFISRVKNYKAENLTYRNDSTVSFITHFFRTLIVTPEGNLRYKVNPYTPPKTVPKVD